MSKETVLADLREHSSNPGRDDYYPASFGRRFIEACEKHDLAVIGVEGFHVDGEYIRPDMRIIASFPKVNEGAWNEYRGAANKRALEYVSPLTAAEGLLLNFVVIDRDDLNRFRKDTNRII